MSDIVEDLRNQHKCYRGSGTRIERVLKTAAAEIARLRLTAAEREAVETARTLFDQGGKQFDHAADRDRADTLKAFLDRHAKGGGA